MTSTERKIAITLRALQDVARRRKHLDRYHAKLMRRLRALEASQARADSPAGQAAARARSAAAEALQAAEKARLLLVNEMARGFAGKVDCRMPIVRYTGTRGACKHARGGGHVHVRGKLRGLICLGSVWRDSDWDTDLESGRLLARLIACCVANIKLSRRPKPEQMVDLLAVMLGRADATAILTGAVKINGLIFGEDPGRGGA